MTPGTSLTFGLDTTVSLFNKEIDPEVTPLSFQVKATYSYLEKTVTEVTKIDLRQYKGATFKKDSLVDAVKELTNAIESRPQ